MRLFIKLCLLAYFSSLCFAFFSSVVDSGLQAQSIGSGVGGYSSSPTNPIPTSIFWNPAIVGALSKSQVQADLGLVGGWFIYDREGQDPNTNENYGSSMFKGMAPNFFVSASSPLGTENFRFAYASYFPSGVIAEFDEKGPQRYDLISGMLIPWHNQFTLAYRLSSELSVAVSGIFSLAFFRTELDVDLSRMMRSVLNSQDIPIEDSNMAARARVPMSYAPSFGAALGVYWRPTYKWSFGFSAFSPMHYEFSGKLSVDLPQATELVGSGLPALGLDQQISSDVSVKTAMPAFFQLGIRNQTFGYWTQEYYGRYILSSIEKSLSLQVDKSNVEMMKDLKLEGTSMKDAWLIGTVQSFPLWQHWLPGLFTSYYRNGASERHFGITRADFDAWNIGGFTKWQASKDFQLGLEYAHAFMIERIAKNTQGSSSSSLFQRPSSDGRYRAAVDKVALMVKYAF